MISVLLKSFIYNTLIILLWLILKTQEDGNKHETVMKELGCIILTDFFFRFHKMINFSAVIVFNVLITSDKALIY